MGYSNHLKTAILLGLLSALLIWVGDLVGGPQGLMFGLFFALIMNFGSYWFSDKLVLKMYKAQEVSEADYKDLYRSVRQVVELAHLPMPKVYVMQNPTPNAFATGRNPKKSAVAFTTGIMDLLSKEELKGVIAHELSHIKNRDTLIATIAATIAAVISYVAMMARWGAMFGGMRGGNDRDGGNMIELLALMIVTPLMATIIQLAISRQREYLADETAARMIKNPYALADALAKLEHGVANRPFNMKKTSSAGSSLFIVNPFSAKSFFSWFSTHPPMKERIERLRKIRIR